MGKLRRLAGLPLILLVACVAVAVPLTKDVRETPQSVRPAARSAEAPPAGADADSPAAAPAEAGVAVPVEQADAPGEPVPGLAASPEPSIYMGFFTRTVERREIEARGASPAKAGLDAAVLRAAVRFNGERWTRDQRRELLAYLREDAVEEDPSFTEADARTIARLQRGSGAEADGKLRDETMAVLFAAGFRFSAREAKAWEVKLEFYPGELEDLDAWEREIEDEVTNNGGDYRHVDAPEGEGAIYVHVGGRIVASYRARGGPPSRLNDAGDHVAVPTKAGVYKLGAMHTHVTSSWQNSQLPWGAEIRETDDGYQYRWPGSSVWSWATPHPACKLKEPFDASDFEGLPEVERGGETLWIWTKNDFGPLAWNLVSSDIYVHTTPDTEADAAQGVETTLAHSHGCIHIDPRERDEMRARGYLTTDVLFVVRKYDEHLLPERIRRDMLNGTGVASGS